ncbi:MAG: hypothetical protein ACMXYE_03655 [Candidatus Woesearchaeota archaeon]
MKFLLSKKAISGYVLWWIVKLVLLFGSVGFIIVIVNAGHNKVDFGSRALDAHVVTHSLLYSPVFMMEDEELGILHSFWIDLEKWNSYATGDASFDSVLSSGDVSYMAINFTLMQGPTSLGSVYYDKGNYLYWQRMYLGGAVRGSGSYDRYVNAYPVVIGQYRERGHLLVEVFVPRG